MNKMGLCQRFWCLMVTVVLVSTVAGIYPDNRTGSARASGIMDIAGQLNNGTIKADEFQNKQGASFLQASAEILSRRCRPPDGPSYIPRKLTLQERPSSEVLPGRSSR